LSGYRADRGDLEDGSNFCGWVLVWPPFESPE
jgi:hypothetical protein